MQGIFEWAADNVLKWLVVGFAALKIGDAVREQKIGGAVMTFVIAVIAYAFVDDPIKFLDNAKGILDKFNWGTK